MPSQELINNAIIKTFRIVKEDYLSDRYKYLSETDVVCSFVWFFKRIKEINKLIYNKQIDVHFEQKPGKNFSQCDLIIRKRNKEEWTISHVLEFKIRINGNKERTLIDFQQMMELEQIGISPFVLIYDRCAKEEQIINFVDEVFSINDRLRKRILWVSRNDIKSKIVNEIPLIEVNNEELVAVKEVVKNIITSASSWYFDPLSETDILYEIYSRLLSETYFQEFYNDRKIDIHCELRPYIKKGFKDFVVAWDKSEKRYSWVPQKRKNEGARVDLTITTRNKTYLKQAYNKANRDQGGKMKYWRILSQPIENSIVFIEIKNNSDIKKDIEKLRLLKRTVNRNMAFQIYRRKS